MAQRYFCATFKAQNASNSPNLKPQTEMLHKMSLWKKGLQLYVRPVSEISENPSLHYGGEGHLCILEEITVTRRGRAMSNTTLVNCWEERGRKGRGILILLHVHMLPLQTSPVTVTALEAYSIILKGSQS